MRRSFLLPLLVGAALVPYASAGSPGLKGVVIARIAAQGEIVVASTGGQTTTLRAPSLPALGTVIRASAFHLADGTSAVQKLDIVGHVHHTTFRGVLIRTVAGTSFFSAGRNVIAVHGHSRTVASARALPSVTPGDTAQVGVTIAPGGDLDEDSVAPVQGASTAQGLMLQVTVASVTPATATAPGTITLTVNGQPLVIPLPAGTVLPSTVAANATVSLLITFPRAAGQGEDDDVAVGTTTTTTTTIPTTPTTTTPTPTTTGTTTTGTTTTGTTTTGTTTTTTTTPTTTTTVPTTVTVITGGDRHGGGSSNGGRGGGDD